MTQVITMTRRHGPSKKQKPVRQGMRNMPPGSGQFIGNQYIAYGTKANPINVFVAQGSGQSIVSSFKGNLEGAALKCDDFYKTFAITNASNKTQEAQELMDLNTAIGQLFAAEDNKRPVFDRVILQFDLASTQRFIFLPAVVLMEDGESFTLTELESVDPIQGIKDVLDANSAHYRLSFGREIQPSGRWDNGTIRFEARKVVWDITRLCNDFATYKARADLAEDLNLELRLVGTVITEDTGTAVQCFGFIKYAYHEEERPLLSREYP
jgi:hypothetical protein